MKRPKVVKTFTTRQAATLTGYSIDTIREAINANGLHPKAPRLPTYRRNPYGHYRITETDLAKWQHQLIVNNQL